MQLNKEVAILRLREYFLELGQDLNISNTVIDKNRKGQVYISDIKTGEIIKDHTTIKELLIENSLLLPNEELN